MLDQYKDGALVETLQLSASKRVYKVGRQAGFADVVLAHASISREHATLTVSASGSVVVCDLGSAHGTSISGKRLPANKPHLLAPGRSLQFGASSRIFKLRADSTGFLTAAGGAASAPPPQTQSARAEALEKALLDALRHGALDGERLRPDGFVRLDAALGCAALAAHRPPPTEREVRELVAAGGAAASDAPLELRDEGGAALIRATSGHAEALGVDASLQLRAATADELRGAGTLVHGAPFLQYNSIRSRGLAGPARFWRRAPAKGEKPHGLQAAPHVLVYVRTASLVDGGSAVYVEEAGGAEELIVLQKPIPLAAARPADDGSVEGELLAPLDGLGELRRAGRLQPGEVEAVRWRLAAVVVVLLVVVMLVVVAVAARHLQPVVQIAEEEGVVVEERHRGARLVGQPEVELEVESADELAEVPVAPGDLGHVRREVARDEAEPHAAQRKRDADRALVREHRQDAGAVRGDRDVGHGAGERGPDGDE